VSVKKYLRDLKNLFFRHFRWFVLIACLAALLFYGLAAFTARPTVETITTPVPVFNADNNKMREIDFQSRKKTRRR
jgi:hypothetical protein